MTADEADELAVQIGRIWPHGRITASVWTEPLRRLDIGPARATLRALRDSDEHPPTIARYLAKHRELHTRHTDRLIEPCALCDGTGWEQTTVARPGHAPTTGVTPCRCSNGRANEDGHRRACDDNDRALGRNRTTEAAA